MVLGIVLGLGWRFRMGSARELGMRLETWRAIKMGEGWKRIGGWLGLELGVGMGTELGITQRLEIGTRGGERLRVAGRGDWVRVGDEIGM